MTLGFVHNLDPVLLRLGPMQIRYYGLGHCSVIVLAGTSTGLVQKYLNWNEKSKGAVILKRICGLLVLAGGVYLVYVAK